MIGSTPRWPLPAAALALALASGAAPAGAQCTSCIAFDNAASAETAAGTTLAWTHTLDPTGAGRDADKRAMVVGVSISRNDSPNPPTVSSVTFAGTFGTVNLTEVAGAGGTTDDRTERISMWMSAALPTGVGPIAGTVTVTLSGNQDAAIVGGSVSVTGVNTATPLVGAAFGTNDNANNLAVLAVVTTDGGFVVDTLAVDTPGALTPATAVAGSGQVQRWNRSPTGDLRGTGSNKAADDTFENMSWTFNQPSLWALGAISLEAAAVTAVDLVSFSARALPGGVLLRWRTGFEVENLGFHLYRQRGGSKVRVNPELVAGSALADGGSLAAGYAYGWWDPEGEEGTWYWLEDVDLAGGSSWHGPFPAAAGPEPGATWAASRTLGEGPSRGQRPAPWRRWTSPADRPVRQPPRGLATSPSAALWRQWRLAAGPAWKLRVRDTGWHRVERDELAAAGLDPGGIDPRRLQLFVDGEEVAVRVTGEGDGSFDPGDAVEFYGQAVDLPSTGARTYWLAVGEGPGRRIRTARPALPLQGLTPVHRETVELKERLVYFPALLNGDEENFFGRVVAASPVEEPLLLHRPILQGGSDALLEVRLQGVTAGPHLVNVELNGADLGVVAFADRARGDGAFEIPSSLLREGVNTVILSRGGYASDVSLVDALRLTYSRPAAAREDRLLVSLGPGESPAQGIRLEGFGSPRIHVFDVTRPGQPFEIGATVSPAPGGYAASFPFRPQRPRTLLATTQEAFLRPAAVAANRPSSWHRTANRADAVILAHRSLLAAARDLADLRRGEGYLVAVVDVEDLYDEFTFGLPSPEALRSFLALAWGSWEQPPRFAVLLGDATYDPRDYLGTGQADLVPTKLIDTERLETASDDWFADFDGDGTPEMAVGRWPARTLGEARILMAKTRRRAAAPSLERALLVADLNDGPNFEGMSRRLAELLPARVEVETLFRSELGPGARQALLDALEGGPDLVNYAGHGSVDVWRGGLLVAPDAALLTNDDPAAVVTVMNCLNGVFHDPLLEGLGEALLRGGDGGAVAAWVSSGTTYAGEQALLMEEFYRLLFTFPDLTLGEAAARAKAAVGGDVARTWVLLGDPMIRLP